MSYEELDEKYLAHAQSSFMDVNYDDQGCRPDLNSFFDQSNEEEMSGYSGVSEARNFHEDQQHDDVEHENDDEEDEGEFSSELDDEYTECDGSSMMSKVMTHEAYSKNERGYHHENDDDEEYDEDEDENEGDYKNNDPFIESSYSFDIEGLFENSISSREMQQDDNSSLRAQEPQTSTQPSRSCGLQIPFSINKEVTCQPIKNIVLAPMSKGKVSNKNVFSKRNTEMLVLPVKPQSVQSSVPPFRKSNIPSVSEKSELTSPKMVRPSANVKVGTSSKAFSVKSPDQYTKASKEKIQQSDYEDDGFDESEQRMDSEDSQEDDDNSHRLEDNSINMVRFSRKETKMTLKNVELIPIDNNPSNKPSSVVVSTKETNIKWRLSTSCSDSGGIAADTRGSPSASEAQISKQVQPRKFKAIPVQRDADDGESQVDPRTINRRAYSNNIPGRDDTNKQANKLVQSKLYRFGTKLDETKSNVMPTHTTKSMVTDSQPPGSRFTSTVTSLRLSTTNLSTVHKNVPLATVSPNNHNKTVSDSCSSSSFAKTVPVSVMSSPRVQPTMFTPSRSNVRSNSPVFTSKPAPVSSKTSPNENQANNLKMKMSPHSKVFVCVPQQFSSQLGVSRLIQAGLEIKPVYMTAGNNNTKLSSSTESIRQNLLKPSLEIKPVVTPHITSSVSTPHRVVGGIVPKNVKMTDSQPKLQSVITNVKMNDSQSKLQSVITDKKTSICNDGGNVESQLSVSPKSGVNDSTRQVQASSDEKTSQTKNVKKSPNMLARKDKRVSDNDGGKKANVEISKSVEIPKSISPKPKTPPVVDKSVSMSREQWVKRFKEIESDYCDEEDEDYDDEYEDYNHILDEELDDLDDRSYNSEEDEYDEREWLLRKAALKNIQSQLTEKEMEDALFELDDISNSDKEDNVEEEKMQVAQQTAKIHSVVRSEPTSKLNTKIIPGVQNWKSVEQSATEIKDSTNIKKVIQKEVAPVPKKLPPDAKSNEKIQIKTATVSNPANVAVPKKVIVPTVSQTATKFHTSLQVTSPSFAQTTLKKEVIPKSPSVVSGSNLPKGIVASPSLGPKNVVPKNAPARPVTKTDSETSQHKLALRQLERTGSMTIIKLNNTCSDDVTNKSDKESTQTICGDEGEKSRKISFESDQPFYDSEYDDDDEDYDSEEYELILNECRRRREAEDKIIATSEVVGKNSSVIQPTYNDLKSVSKMTEHPTDCKLDDDGDHKIGSNEDASGCEDEDAINNEGLISTECHDDDYSDECDDSLDPDEMYEGKKLNIGDEIYKDMESQEDGKVPPVPSMKQIVSSEHEEKDPSSVDTKLNKVMSGLKRSSEVLAGNQPKLLRNMNEMLIRTNIKEATEKNITTNVPNPTENCKRKFKYANRLSDNIKHIKLNEKDNDFVNLKNLNELAKNKNLTISIVQPANVTSVQIQGGGGGPGGGPNRNNMPFSNKGQLYRKFIKCQSCGTFSSNLSYCDGCQKSFSPDKDLANKSLSISSSSGSALVNKKQFYGSKLKGNFNQQNAEGTKSANQNFSENTPVRKTPLVRKTKPKRQEPVCLTLSSDEEGESGHRSLSGGDDRTDPQNDDDDASEQSSANKPRSECSSGRNTPLSSMEPLLQSPSVVLQCRSIRIGSYRKVDTHTVTITPTHLSFSYTTITGAKDITVLIPKREIKSILVHFSASMPVVFVNVSQLFAVSLRQLLEMNTTSGPFYNPESDDETQKRICLIPEKVPSDVQEMFKSNYVALLQMIRRSVANELLVRSTPSMQISATDNTSSSQAENNNAIATNSSVVSNETKSIPQSTTITRIDVRPKPEVYHMVTYPRQSSAGRISITSEDYECLYPGEYLNDVIIDFYLKYLFLEKLSVVDRERTHIFSSFFYGRLTTKPQGNFTEEDGSLKIQQKRHGRVKKWTRNLDIFSKDFIIIPINEKSHWFLAIVCFPGKVQNIPGIKRPLTADSEEEDDVKYPSKLPKVDDSPSAVQCSLKSDTDAAKNSKSGDTSIDKALVKYETGKLVDYDDNDSSNNEEMETDQGACHDDMEDEGVDDSSANDDSSRLTAGDDASNEASAAEQSSSQAKKDFVVSGTALDPKMNCKKPCILIFDSLIMPRAHTAVISTLRDYLTEEWSAKKRTEKFFTKDNMKGANLKCPQQDNYSDCGVYVLQYVESFFETPIYNFNIPLKGLECWFSEEKVKTKRAEIQSCIENLARAQGTNIDFLESRKPIIVPEHKVENMSISHIIVSCTPIGSQETGDGMSSVSNVCLQQLKPNDETPVDSQTTDNTSPESDHG